MEEFLLRLMFDYIGVVFTAIFYGLYCLIFGLYWRIQLKRSDRWKGILLYPLTASFILCTVYFIVSIIQVQFVITMTVLDEDTYASAVSWMVIATNALYTVIDLISQLILLYRCWIMWHKPLIMVIPCIFSLAFLATALTILGIQIRGTAIGPESQFMPPDWYTSGVTAFFFLSLGVNTLVTALIVYKIVSVYNDIRGFNTSNAQASAYGNQDGRRDLYPLISILIESGLITFIGQLTQSIMYKTATIAFPLVAGSVVMLYGISTTVVLVRVEMGLTYDHNTTKTAYYTNSRRGPIQLAPFPSKLNHSTTTTTDFESPDDPNDALSVRKLIPANR